MSGRSSRPAPIAGAGDGWRRLRPRTLVDMVIDELIAGAARGLILPGDRIVESAMAKHLGISRVPVREALRILESQGLVVSEPYKGIRLTPVTPERINQLIEVRVVLETTAATRAIQAGRNGSAEIAALTRQVDEMELMATREDAYGFGNADTGFHRALCTLGGNDVLCGLWEGFSRQMTVFFGLSTFGKPTSVVVEEHRLLVDVFRSGDVAAMAAALDEHISAQTRAMDFQTIIERRKADRAALAPKG